MVRRYAIWIREGLYLYDDHMKCTKPRAIRQGEITTFDRCVHPNVRGANVRVYPSISGDLRIYRN